jgi:hypothetical protein
MSEVASADISGHPLVMDGNVNQQCKSDPFSVYVPECRPPVASKDGETLSGKGGSAATRPFNMLYTYDQICENRKCKANFSIEAFKADLIPLDKGSAYGEKGCYKCADTPREKLKVCKKYIKANMVEDMEPEDRDEFLNTLRAQAGLKKKVRLSAEEQELEEARLADEACVQDFEGKAGDKVSQMGPGAKRAKPGAYD